MKIGFIGCGNMARAVIEGLLREKTVEPADVAAVASRFERLRIYTDSLGIKALATIQELLAFAEVVVIAVKPYLLSELLPPLLPSLRGKAVISFAAGQDFEALEALIPGIEHISTLPNLAMCVGQGVLVSEEKHSLSQTSLTAFTEIFGRIALIDFVPTSQFGIAGVLSGCGPAYVAMFAEALADAGVKHGLTRDRANRLSAAMLAGAGSLLMQGEAFAQLKDRVCSPGGTTIKGVASLERDAFRGAVIRAIDTVMGEV